MGNTIQDLIDSLQAIEDKSQVYAGSVWIAEDFFVDNLDGEEVPFTPEQLAKVIEWRSVEKSIGFTYDTIHESLCELSEDN